VMKTGTGSIFLLDEKGTLCCRRSGACPRSTPGRVSGWRGYHRHGGSKRPATVVSDTAADPRGTYLGLGNDGVRAFASVPVAAKGGAGDAHVASHEPREFTSHDVRLLEDVAADSDGD